MLQAPAGFGSRFTAPTRRFLLGSALMGAAQAIPWTLLNLYLDRRGFTKAEIGLVQSCDAWGKVLIAIPAALLLATRRTPPLLVVSSLLAGLCYLALPWLGSLHAIMACNLCAGLAWSVHYVAIAPFLFRHTRSPDRATVFGLAEAVHTGAAVLGAFIAGRGVVWLAPHLGGDTNALAWVVSSGGLLALAASLPYASIREDRPLASSARSATPAMLWHHRNLLVRFAVPQGIIACGAGLCIPFLGLYFQDRFGLAPGHVGNLYSAGQVLMTTGYLLTPFALRRMGFVKSIVFFELLSIPFFLTLAFTASLPLAVLAFLMRGALMNSATPLLKNFSMHVSPENGREVQNGMTSFVNGIGWVIGPRIGGYLLDASGDNYRTLMCTTVGFYIAAALATYFLVGPLEEARVVGGREADGAS